MNTLDLPSQALLKCLFEYSPKNPSKPLVYKATNKYTRCVNVGDEAGNIESKYGYYQVKINNITYKMHRLVFMYHNGYCPDFIDHMIAIPVII